MTKVFTPEEESRRALITRAIKALRDLRKAQIELGWVHQNLIDLDVDLREEARKYDLNPDFLDIPSQVIKEVSCPCGETFMVKRNAFYSCPKCGTTITEKIPSQVRRHPLDGWNGWSTLPARCAVLDKEFGDD